MSTPVAPSSDDPSPSRGLGLRLIAVVLILVGSLDMMLSWRGSMPLSGFYVALFFSGIVLFGVSGVLASRGHAPSQSENIDKI